MAQEIAVQPKYDLPRMKSVERISKLPAVEQTVDLANNLYVKVKDTNVLVRSVLTTAETTGNFVNRTFINNDHYSLGSK